MLKIHISKRSIVNPKGNIKRGINLLKNAIRLKPDFLNAHYNLGITQKKQGKIHDAIDSLKQALKFQPNFPG